MKHDYSRAEIEAYLLGKGSDEERAALAEALIVDPDLHALMQEIECDQIDALARGDLRVAEAAAWQTFLEQTGQLDRLRIARAMAIKSKPRRRALWWLEVAAALLLVGGGAWWWMGIEKRPGPTLVARRVSLALPRDITRGTNTNLELTIAKDVSEVEFQFEVAAEPASGYRLRVLNSGGAAVLVREGKGWPATPLKVALPAAEIPAGRIRLELVALNSEGQEAPVAFHEVRVVKIDK
ncbi:MAG: hypothetical protein NTW74_03100 [Acidobacteria bacterium]|nr:hypothetical protein [Acidobacteriota bacterium]